MLFTFSCCCVWALLPDFAALAIAMLGLSLADVAWHNKLRSSFTQSAVPADAACPRLVLLHAPAPPVLPAQLLPPFLQTGLDAAAGMVAAAAAAACWPELPVPLQGSSAHNLPLRRCQSVSEITGIVQQWQGMLQAAGTCSQPASQGGTGG